MKSYVVIITLASALTVFVSVIRQSAQAQSGSLQAVEKTETVMPGPVGRAGAQPSPLRFVTEMPVGYRDWRLISVAHEEGTLHSFAAVLGNDVAIKAFREGTLPFPDGTIIASLHYHHISSEENNQVFGKQQSFIAGDPSNVQFMIKDSKAYASTGGWGFGHFQTDKALTDPVKLKSCFDCHAENKERDLVFTRYAP